jgi:hypothetical protein
MPAALLPDCVVDCLRILRQDRHHFRNGLEETAKAVVRSRELIAHSRELLRRVEQGARPDPAEKVHFRVTAWRPPVCIDCRLPMQIAASRPDTIPQLRHVLFACECGRISDQVVAEPDQ